MQRGKLEEEFVCEDEKFSKIVKLLQHIEEISDPFQKYPGVDKAIVVKILSVDDTYRGRGIAKELMSKTIDLAKGRGCGFCSVDCSSYYTARAAKKLGFELHYTLKYEDYKVDGKSVFDPVAPHKAMTVYTQKIS
ncbi:unnamed protein product [Phaedon cochleariae]|nr:unnamed protein product [Phaedon cochleariae]